MLNFPVPIEHIYLYPSLWAGINQFESYNCNVCAYYMSISMQCVSFNYIPPVSQATVC